MFIEVKNGQRRILLRGNRDYGSKKKLKKAVEELQEIFCDAGFLDATGPTEPFRLPATSFRLVPDVLPLLVGEPPDAHDDARSNRRTGRAIPLIGVAPTSA